ncbi:lysozyme 2-like [Centruroides sculpturatus]|uniref:lysozyme 2-like n=1 Tax=Centruroides sculpturatus TaxID=218467 RepID=UPI000C6D67FA|nr:lysozyme 2-like [Centruroides sculpturatus]
MFTLLLLNVVFALVTGQYYEGSYQDTSPVSAQCLQCICEASTGCDLNMGCHNAGHGAYYCGPYLISWAYWSEGGKVGQDPRNPHDFEVCLKDKTCSEQTIQGYMTKWGYDCDKDGDVDCYDYSSIHKAGPYGCNGTWYKNTDYWRLFENCFY